MRGRLLVSLCVAAGLFASIASPGFAEEVIESFRSDIVLDRNGTVSVNETIRVRAEGKEIKRGIYRDILTAFQDAEGELHCLGFKLLGVTRDGSPEPYFTERQGDFTRIYAGDRNVFLSAGSYTYIFSYEIDHHIRWVDDRPELLWSVTGSDWAFPMLQASFGLTLPGGAAPVRWDAYTGQFRKRGSDFHGVLKDGLLEVKATRRLDPGQGLTVVVEIPAGSVERLAEETPRCEFTLREDPRVQVGARVPASSRGAGGSTINA